MRLINGQRPRAIARQLAEIEPAFGIEAVKNDIVEALQADHYGPIQRPSDLDAAFGRLGGPLRVAVATAGRHALALGAARWSHWSLAALTMMRDASADAALFQLLQLLFSLDLGRTQEEAAPDLSDHRVPGHLLFRKASPRCNLNLDTAQIFGVVDARGMSLSGELHAAQASFLGPVWLDGCRISGDVRFVASRFHSNLTAEKGRFRGLWLRYADIGGLFHVSQANFDGEASFGAARYRGPTSLSAAHFHDTVSFEGARFEAPVSLDGATFDRRVFMANASFGAGFSADGTRFGSDVVPPLATLDPASNEPLERFRRVLDAFKG